MYTIHYTTYNNNLTGYTDHEITENKLFHALAVYYIVNKFSVNKPLIENKLTGKFVPMFRLPYMNAPKYIQSIIDKFYSDMK